MSTSEQIIAAEKMLLSLHVEHDRLHQAMKNVTAEAETKSKKFESDMQRVSRGLENFNERVDKVLAFERPQTMEQEIMGLKKQVEDLEKLKANQRRLLQSDGLQHHEKKDARELKILRDTITSTYAALDQMIKGEQTKH